MELLPHQFDLAGELRDSRILLLDHLQDVKVRVRVSRQHSLLVVVLALAKATLDFDSFFTCIYETEDELRHVVAQLTSCT